MTVSKPGGTEDPSAEPVSGEATVLQTLARGLGVLEAVAEGNGTATPKTLARQLGIKQSTCYHLLRTLRADGYVVRLPGGNFDIGPRGSTLGKHLSARTGPAPEISAILTRLHNKTRETSYVCGWYHGTILMQQVLHGLHSLTVKNLDVGYVGNMHARASCLAVLAHLPASQVATMFDGTPLTKLTANTISDFNELTNELETIRRRGYALDIEAFAEDVCCVSAPFFDPSGTPAGSFSVSVPVSRFQQTRTALSTEVREAGALATNLLKTGRLVITAAPNSPESRSL
ncbi:IclR family transcriptional regulator [Mycolicibacterium neoaurum]|uniref:IclR family transcriptional regulator n=1 Tax=Mycolicibacterium neoaurum TaxID=1795 RepID=A0AAV2WEJ1_MYCNE|nr:IclR family transcriptional regulator [Mycolicibacterium neoaurum]TLH59324.1 IclR family transcriptional regulator [Mycolicibacterium neoaurum]CDQ42574.1 IclR family transcriptional regulator [Mycolicibacterium neoaurum]